MARLSILIGPVVVSVNIIIRKYYQTATKTITKEEKVEEREQYQLSNYVTF